MLSFLLQHADLRQQAYTELSKRYTAIKHDALSGAWHRLIGEELTHRAELQGAAPVLQPPPSPRR